MTDIPSARRMLLIGSEASQAMSPSLWSPVLVALGIGWSYEPLDVPADADMGPIRQQLLSPEVVAANVTMPHKQWAARTADVATEPVQRCGAANTLIPSDRGLKAYNTDIDAFTALSPAGHQAHALLLGAGGAARASLAALYGRVERVTITDRDTDASEQLVEQAGRLGMTARMVSWSGIAAAAPTATLIVNATPIGKHAEDPPAWGSAKLSANASVYDFVYANHPTATVREARRLNLNCVDGWDHLWAQAAAMVPLLHLPIATPELLQQSIQRIRKS